MFRIMFFTILSMVFVVMAGDSFASRVASNSTCKMNETVNININFNGTLDKASGIQAIIDEKNAKILSLAKELGITDIRLKSQNFNINSNNNHNNGGVYNYNSNSGFTLKPYDKAFALLDKLKENNYQASMNVNRYSQGNCN